MGVKVVVKAVVVEVEADEVLPLVEVADVLLEVEDGDELETKGVLRDGGEFGHGARVEGRVITLHIQNLVSNVLKQAT